MSRQSNWVALNALITEAMNSPCAVDAPESPAARHSLADALTDQLCNDVIVTDASGPRRGSR